MNKSRKAGQWKTSALALMIGLALAGCGGSGAGKGGGPNWVGESGDRNQVQDVVVKLLANSGVLPANGSMPVDLTAIATDPLTGVAIVGKKVDFSVNDPNPGGVRLEVTQAETDASGMAMARLHLNGDPTEREVTVLASVEQKNPGELGIRVANEAGTGGVVNTSRGELTVRLATDNKVLSGESLNYVKSYVAIVTDSAGFPKPNATIRPTLRPRSYYVGYWAPFGTVWGTIYLTPDGVPNEDLANFGVCDSGEDVNNDKGLTPGNHGSWTVRSQTDQHGMAVIDIAYGKSLARWLDMELEVTAEVGGSEGSNAVLFRLPVLADDVRNLDIIPPSTERPRGSLSTSTMPMPSGTGEETLPIPDSRLVPGSPFPLMNQTPTC